MGVFEQQPACNYSISGIQIMDQHNLGNPDAKLSADSISLAEFNRLKVLTSDESLLGLNITLHLWVELKDNYENTFGDEVVLHLFFSQSTNSSQ